MVWSTSRRTWALTTTSRFMATYATATTEAVRMTVSTSILWASLRFFTRFPRDFKAAKGDGSGSGGQVLLDDGEGPPGVQDDQQLAGQLAHGVDEVDAAHVRCHGSLVVSREGLDPVRVGGLDLRDLVHHHAERAAHRRLE